MSWKRKDLLGMRDLEASEITDVLDTAVSMKEIASREIKKVPTLRGKTVVNLFYESSTRTRTSFEIAGKWLSADVINFSASGSSADKGESLLDTARNIEAMSPDVVVVRHKASGAPALLARHLRCGVVNAGDGAHEHPTQALLDLLTLRRRLGSDSFRGLRVGIVGDVRHSRVARSNVKALHLLGADVTLVAPPTLLPESLEGWPVQVSYELDDVVSETDVVMLLRMQFERQQEALFPTVREYTARYGLTEARAERLKPDALVMHPGPMNRGVEVAAAVADGPASLVTEQVANGVAVRMAVLYSLLGSGAPVA
jgi:aspartate carbamoyltransferase catalytic subunit